MKIPLTSKVSLRKIIESLDKIPTDGFGTQPQKLSSEQKKQLLKLSSMYESFGECLRNEESLMSAAKGITELCELAETYALNECGEWFQQELVKKDMNELKKKVGEFQKIMKEAYARMQQAGVSYQDIGHYLGRYFNLKNPSENLGPQPPQTTPGPQTLQQEADELQMSTTHPLK